MNTKTPINLGSAFLTGRVTGLAPSGKAFVQLEGHLSGPIEARSLVPLATIGSAAEVLVQITSDVAAVPVIMGVLDPETTSDLTVVDSSGISTSLELTAERELTLRCGKASITLTKEGKIILRGTYISSRSSGPNRIKGGSVHLN